MPPQNQPSRSQLFGRCLAAALAGCILTATVPSRAAQDGNADPLRERLRQAELLAGLTAAEGSGVTVVLRHSPKTTPRGVDRRNLMVRERDVNAVLNALRAASAEAIAIGGTAGPAAERITALTALRETPTGLSVNGAELRPPYRITAIGSGAAIRAELLRPGGVVKSAGLDLLHMIDIQDEASVTIPGLRSAPGFQYARAVETSTAISEFVALKPNLAAPAQPYIARRATPVSKPVSQPVENVTPTVTPPVTVAKSRPTSPKPNPEVLPKEPKTSTVMPGGSTMATGPGTGKVYGGKGLAKYHVGACRFGERVDPSQRVHFSTVDEAVKAGRQPCQICNPMQQASRPSPGGSR